VWWAPVVKNSKEWRSKPDGFQLNPIRFAPLRERFSYFNLLGR
jgi:hypothetical protein